MHLLPAPPSRDSDGSTATRWPSRKAEQARATISTLTQALAAAFVVTFLVMAILRLAYPYEVSWLESSMYTMMRAKVAGHSPYAKPTIGYAPCLYPPLYFHLAALVARLRAASSWPDFFPLRLVSAASALGVFTTIAWVLRARHRRAWQVALVHAALWLALDGRWGGWLDSSRVDSLFTLLLLLAVTALFEGDGAISALASGLFAAGAVLTKQPGALLWLVALLVDLARRRRPARTAAAVAAGAMATTTYLVATGELANPYFFFWMLEVPASHPLRATLFLRGLAFVALTMTPWLLAGLWPGVRWLRTPRLVRETLSPWTATLPLWLVALLLLRAKEGASTNFFMPLAPLVAITAARGLKAMSRAWIAPDSDAHTAAARRCSCDDEPSPGRDLIARVRPFVVPLLSLLQFALLIYDPRDFAPTPAATREATAFVARLTKVEGDVWIPAFPSYAVFAGKRWYAHETALFDLRNTPAAPLLDRAYAEVRSNPAFGGIVLDPREPLLRAATPAQARREPLPPFTAPFLRRLHDGHLAEAMISR